MSKIEIDFNNLQYNLYEILNINPNSSEKIIKKAFIKLIKTFHPDKNSKIEEDIYQHIILSNQILLNRESRDKYDAYLELRIDTFNDLKSQFNKSSTPLNTNKQSLETNLMIFNEKVSMLDKKHGMGQNKLIPTVDRYNNIKSQRDDIVVEKENIKNIEEFNTKFLHYKVDGKLKDQIVEYDKNSEILTFSTDSYVNLDNIDKLYLEGSVVSSEYASLDHAFSLQPIPTYQSKNILLTKEPEYYKSKYQEDLNSIKMDSRYIKLDIKYK